MNLEIARFLTASNLAIDLRGSAKESFVNHLIGQLQVSVELKNKLDAKSLTRMFISSYQYAVSQNEN